MNIKHLLMAIICLLSYSSFAQTSPSAAKQSQFILIIRSKADSKPSAEAIQINIKHWQEYMGNLSKNGKIAGGYRPGTDGETITESGKSVKGPYVANGEVVSSFLIINAADMAEAKQIAAKCPVFELKGSVEIRPIQNTAN